MKISLRTVALSTLVLAALQPLHAQTEKVLYSFCSQLNGQVCSDGAYPKGGVVKDKHGNLYGTVLAGSPNNLGAVYKITSSGQYSVFYSFLGTPDGAKPEGGLVIDSAGNLYGTTESGGTFSELCAANFGCGTVFKITQDGTESVLYTFGTASSQDGTEPVTDLTLDSAGNLYGVTNTGGTLGGGTVFKLTPSGQETTLYNFSPATNSPGPAIPFAYGSLAIDSAGNLYGTSSYGGGSNGGGTVFKITPEGQETTLYAFCAKGKNEFCATGSSPQAGLIIDNAGNLWGTTFAGGTFPGPSGQGDGTVFRITPADKHLVLYNFGASSVDATKPVAGLTTDHKGNLYGTTVSGGSIGQYGDGAVFKITVKGGITEEVLWNFGGTSDGTQPEAAPLVDNAGNLYGTASSGGANGYGAVWEVIP